MKEKVVEVMVCPDVSVCMKVEVDEEGEEWLSPDQVGYLEHLHNTIVQEEVNENM